MSGWIKLHRSLKDWEWYDDINATRLLIHLLLTVNYEQKRWKGIIVEAGTRITSFQILADETGLSVKQIRVAMEKLESSGEVARKVARKGQAVTLCKWEELQKEESKGASNKTLTGQGEGKERATTKEGKEIEEFKEVKNEDSIVDSNESPEPPKPKFNFKSSMVDYGFNSSLVSDWLKVRSKKKATNTETAFNGFIKIVEKSPRDKNDILETCVIQSWAGYKDEWYNKLENNGHQKNSGANKTAATSFNNETEKYDY